MVYDYDRKTAGANLFSQFEAAFASFAAVLQERVAHETGWRLRDKSGGGMVGSINSLVSFVEPESGKMLVLKLSLVNLTDVEGSVSLHANKKDFSPLKREEIGISTSNDPTLAARAVLAAVQRLGV
jgi:hypothetical protein